MTVAEQVPVGAHPAPDDVPAPPVPAGPVSGRRSFHVTLDNFDGPFDLLLQLISKREMDLTQVALHQVTDEFIALIRRAGNDWSLDQVTEFLVVAATLLEMKAARLLPDPEADNPEDLELLEARDLLFARLLAYRAYQQVTVLFQELEAGALRRYPRAVTLEERYLSLLPEVRIGMDATAFAELAAAVFRPKPPPTVDIDHIHASPVSVAEHTAIIRALLVQRRVADFSELVAGCTQVLEVVARFLGLLNLYRESAVAFEQPQPLGDLTIRWTGAEATDPSADLGTAGGPGAEEEYE